MEIRKLPCFLPITSNCAVFSPPPELACRVIGPPVSSAGGNGEATRVFWTVPIPDSDVEVQGTSGKAEMHVHGLQIRDYSNIPNALGPVETTPFVSATVSFDVVWSGPITRRINIQDGTNDNTFAGEFVENQATVTWSATNALGFSFTANPGTLETSDPDAGPIVELGKERNGDFVNSNSDRSAAALVQGSTVLTSPGGLLFAPPVLTTLPGSPIGPLSSPDSRLSTEAANHGIASGFLAGSAGAAAAPDSDSVAALFIEIGRLG